MKRLPTLLSAVFFLSTMALFSPASVTEAQSQFSIQLGGDFGRAKRQLIQQGYSQIRLVGQGFTKFQVEACHNGVRYWFKANSRGRVDQKQRIGTCRSTVTIEQVKRQLASQGYSRINVEDRGNRFLAVACYGNERMRLRIDNLGQIGKRRVLGACRKTLNPADVTVALQSEGYTRIKFTDRQLPVYGVNACLGKRKFKLQVNEYAETLSQKRQGQCSSPVTSKNLAGFLKRHGYTRIVIIDNKLPRYVAEVCDKSSKRLEITMNRYGEIIDRANRGTCTTRANSKQITAVMRNHGYSRMTVNREDKKRIVIGACHSDKLIRVEFNGQGEFINEKEVGDCPPRLTIRQTKIKLEAQDYRNVHMYLEGCRKGRLVRFQINNFGDRVRSKTIGVCK